jgi:hypothetical protein
MYRKQRREGIKSYDKYSRKHEGREETRPEHLMPKKGILKNSRKAE